MFHVAVSQCCDLLPLFLSPNPGFFASQAEDKEIIQCAIRTCSRLFGALLTRGELFVGKLPPEEDSVQGNYSAEEKYKIWMRHRYNSCATCLGELMAHEAFQVKAPFPIYQKNAFTLISSIVMPSEESEIKKFLVNHANQEEWKVSRLKEHRRAFERMWLGFLKYKLPGSLYKKVLVILHDSILPHLNEPTLLMDFLTVAYDVGEWGCPR
ncbi:Nucleolar complex protein 4-like protein, partial [Ophiophagus hannah]